MGERLTVRKKIIQGESLLSYFHRCANANGMNFFALINLVRKNRYKLHSGDVHRLDFYPENAVNLQKLFIITGLTKTEVFQASFSNVLLKLKGQSKEENCMFLGGMLRDQLHYCPKCLLERKNLNLLWKVNGIDTCLTHKLPLKNSCNNCNKEIAIKDIHDIGICPYCHSDLSKLNTKKELASLEKLEGQRMLHQNWSMLINSPNDVCLDEKEIAIRLLYILNDQRDVICRQDILNKITPSKLTHFLQIARGTTKKRTIHLQTILDILGSLRMDLLFFMNVPPKFNESLNNDKTLKLINDPLSSIFCYPEDK